MSTKHVYKNLKYWTWKHVGNIISQLPTCLQKSAVGEQHISDLEVKSTSTVTRVSDLFHSKRSYFCRHLFQNATPWGALLARASLRGRNKSFKSRRAKRTGLSELTPVHIPRASLSMQRGDSLVLSTREDQCRAFLVFFKGAKEEYVSITWLVLNTGVWSDSLQYSVPYHPRSQEMLRAWPELVIKAQFWVVDPGSACQQLLRRMVPAAEAPLASPRQGTYPIRS